MGAGGPVPPSIPHMPEPRVPSSDPVDGAPDGGVNGTADGAALGGVDVPVDGSADAPQWRAWSPGTRVVVRRVRDDVPVDEAAAAGGEPRYTDVLGDVVAVDDDGVVVRTRRGDVTVPAAAIRLTKVVPPAPERRGRRTP